MDARPISPQRAPEGLPRPRRSAPAAVSRRGFRKYSRGLKDLACFLWERGRTLTHATEKDAAAWVRALKKRARAGRRRLAGSTIFRRIVAARGFFEQLKGRLARNPFARYKTRRSDRSVEARGPLGDRELRRLVGAFDPETPWGLRDRAICLLRFSAGLELSEICRLERSQLLLRGRKSAIRLVRRDGSVRRIPLRGPVLTALRKHLAKNGRRGPYVFGPIASRRGARPGRPHPLSVGPVSLMLREARRILEDEVPARARRVERRSGRGRSR